MNDTLRTTNTPGTRQSGFLDDVCGILQYSPSHFTLFIFSPAAMLLNAGHDILILAVSRSHTIRTTVGMTPLDEWSARRTDLYLTAYNTHNRQAFMPLAIFEPTVSVGERPQTYALGRGHTILTSREDSVSPPLDCATTGADRSNLHNYSLKITDVHHISVQTSTWPVFRIMCSIFNFLVKGMISCSVQTPHFKPEYVVCLKSKCTDFPIDELVM